jgi:hypothetical protein
MTVERARAEYVAHLRAHRKTGEGAAELLA